MQLEQTVEAMIWTPPSMLSSWNIRLASFRSGLSQKDNLARRMGMFWRSSGSWSLRQLFLIAWFCCLAFRRRRTCPFSRKLLLPSEHYNQNEPWLCLHLVAHCASFCEKNQFENLSLRKPQVLKETELWGLESTRQKQTIGRLWRPSNKILSNFISSKLNHLQTWSY